MINPNNLLAEYEALIITQVNLKKKIMGNLTKKNVEYFLRLSL